MLFTNASSSCHGEASSDLAGKRGDAVGEAGDEETSVGAAESGGVMFSTLDFDLALFLADAQSGCFFLLLPWLLSHKILSCSLRR